MVKKMSNIGREPVWRGSNRETEPGEPDVLEVTEVIHRRDLNTLARKQEALARETDNEKETEPSLEGELYGLERRARILQAHRHEPADYAHLREQKKALAKRIKGDKKLEERLSRITFSEIVGQGEPVVGQDVERPRSKELEQADSAYRAKLDYLANMLVTVDQLLNADAPSKTKIKKMLDGVVNALGGAHLTYAAETERALTKSLIERADMLARKIILDQHRLENILEVAPARETKLRKLPRKTRQGNRKRILPGMVPEHLLRTGVTLPEKPDIAQIVLPSEERLGKKTEGFGERLRHGFAYLWNRGKREGAEKAELKEIETFGETAKMTAALARTAVTFGGAYLDPELVKHMPASLLSKKETEQLELMLRAVAEGGTKSPDEQGYDSYKEGVRRLAERVSASRYGTPKEKGKILGDIMRATITPQDDRTRAEREQLKVSAELLTKPREEMTSNTTLILGEHLLRAPAYDGEALIARFKTVARDGATDATARERIRKFIADQFAETAKTWNGGSTRQKAYAGLKTIGKALGAAGFAYATRELWEVMPTVDTLTQDELRVRIDDALEASEARDDVHVLQELSAHEALWSGAETLGEHGTVSVPLAEAEISEYSAGQLAAGTVRKGDGITQALIRVIAENPKQFGYVHDQLAFDLNARKLALTMVKNDGLLRTWLNDQAVGNLLVLPVMRSDGWHVEFLDAKTHEEISGKALKAFTKAQPRP
ncbi:MAG: hypothetical protein WC813_00700 [Patescibacteria group bacterium]|jgi:hypothetical protein